MTTRETPISITACGPSDTVTAAAIVACAGRSPARLVETETAGGWLMARVEHDSGDEIATGGLVWERVPETPEAAAGRPMLDPELQALCGRVLDNADAMGVLRRWTRARDLESRPRRWRPHRG